MVSRRVRAVMLLLVWCDRPRLRIMRDRPPGSRRRIAVTGSVCAGALSLVVAALVLSGTAWAGSGAIRMGFYTYLGDVPSARITMHVRARDSVPDLVLVCFPKDTSLTAGNTNQYVVVKMPKVTIRDDRISYRGQAVVTAKATGKKVATTSLRVNLRHDDGPVYHDGHMRLRRAWIGTVSVQVCTRRSLVNWGVVYLWGPVPATHQ